ncbi:acyltransferase [Bradyrhizobium sp. dw_78]|uniref:acyltransferase family protein n=1 Tax=Bradyrhizobium sp. dw_78 TaxID=2719793 RepID=UPI001BD25361|nr:acyltransferase [Bradyrhizobium sp. dw_78]
MQAIERGVVADQSVRQESRIVYLESIRGLAALQVLLLHFLAAFAPDLVYSLPSTATVAAYVHLSPLYFIYDGYSAVYIFFALSGYVLTRSFERNPATPIPQILGRIVRLGLPAAAAVSVAAMVMLAFGKPNVQAGELTGSAWFASQWNAEVSVLSVIRDGTVNALFLGYRGLPGVAFLAPWQQAVDQSFVAPLWTLSIEFYGSMIVLMLCWCARRSRALWWSALLLGTIFTARSAYLCFFVGHLLAAFSCAERPAPASKLLPVFCIAFGVFWCVLAEIWQPEWLRMLCSSPTYLLFPGQFAPMQQKTFGAILVLVGIINLEAARSFLSTPWLIARSKLSFPLYLIHWPVLFGPSAALFLLLNGMIGLELSRLSAIVAGICLAFLASVFFLPVDHRALEWSRALRKRMSFGSSREGSGMRSLHPMAAE